MYEVHAVYLHRESIKVKTKTAEEAYAAYIGMKMTQSSGLAFYVFKRDNQYISLTHLKADLK